MEALLTFENLLLLVPLLIIEIGLMGFCIYKIFTEGVANLSKWKWCGIVLTVILFGAILFLIIGRRRELN